MIKVRRGVVSHIAELGAPPQCKQTSRVTNCTKSQASEHSCFPTFSIQQCNATHLRHGEESLPR